VDDNAKALTPAPMGPDDPLRLLHELQVHQAELAQQNEDLRAARSDLEASLARQTALFEFSPIALVTVDERNRVTDLNRRARELLGAQAQIGVTLIELVARDSRDALARVLDGRAARAEVDCLFAAADGSARTAVVQVCRPQPYVGSLFVALAESTDQHRAERAQQARALAEQANREKSTFLARMSHELRTPLNAVLGFAHLLSRDPAVAASPTAADRVRRIHGAGLHLLALVNEVLDLARLEAGSVSVLPEDFDAAALLAEVASMLAPLAARHPAHLRIAPCEVPAHVTADRARTRQVLINLVDNAIKYNRAGGEVGLGVTVHGDEVAITVSDVGQGLTAEQQSGLFVAFERLGAERSAVAGIGLGLAIARQLMEAMHGRLEVRSAPDQGSVFTVTLPRAKCAAVPAASAVGAAPAARVGVPLCVLYVEDNPVNSEVMKSVLGDRPNVRLVLAEDGASGLALLRELRPDLVLLDMQLPDMDGLEFFAHMRADPRIVGTPCVAVSANAMAQDVSAALGAGLDGYLTKPVDFEALMALIDRTRPRGARPAPP
jgi:PAS domain S-box-containing protein